MYKKIFSIFVFLLIFSLGFALAAQDNGQNEGHGDDQDAGAGEGSGLQDSNQNAGDTQQNTEQNRVKVQNGTYVIESGKTIRVETQANNRVKIESGGVSAECACEMKEEKIQNKTRLYAQLSDGRNAEIKVMPDAASERALERLRLKVCSEENNCSIELKEVGADSEEKQLVYEMQIQRRSRILGIFQKKMQVKVQVSAEDGELIRVKKPWWAFLASEPAEE